MLIPVPYVSQWDATAHFSRGDCGIVAADMIALFKSIAITPDEMIQRAGLPIGAHSYDFAQIVQGAGAIGLKLVTHESATWDVIKAELDAGRPTVTLVRYGEISGNQDDFDGSHFWTTIGYDAFGVYVNDPDWWGDRRIEGAQRYIPITEFQNGIGSALIETGNKAYQSLFISE